MADLVQIKHPDLPTDNPGTVSREAFDEIWADKGFQIVGDDGEPIKAAKPTPAKTAGGAA